MRQVGDRVTPKRGGVGKKKPNKAPFRKPKVEHVPHKGRLPKGATTQRRRVRQRVLEKGTGEASVPRDIGRTILRGTGTRKQADRANRWLRRKFRAHQRERGRELDVARGAQPGALGPDTPGTPSRETVRRWLRSPAAREKSLKRQLWSGYKKNQLDVLRAIDPAQYERVSAGDGGGGWRRDSLKATGKLLGARPVSIPIKWGPGRGSRIEPTVADTALAASMLIPGGQGIPIGARVAAALGRRIAVGGINTAARTAARAVGLGRVARLGAAGVRSPRAGAVIGRDVARALGGRASRVSTHGVVRGVERLPGRALRGGGRSLRAATYYGGTGSLAVQLPSGNLGKTFTGGGVAAQQSARLAGKLPAMGGKGVGRVVRNTAYDAINLPANIIPMAYIPAEAVYKAVKGDPEHWNQLVEDFKTHDAWALLAQGKFAEAAEAAAEHPLWTALEAVGGVRGTSRGAGIAARAAGSKRYVRGLGPSAKDLVGGTRLDGARAPGLLGEGREWSPGVIEREIQAVRDRRVGAKLTSAMEAQRRLSATKGIPVSSLPARSRLAHWRDRHLVDWAKDHIMGGNSFKITAGRADLEDLRAARTAAQKTANFEQTVKVLHEIVKEAGVEYGPVVHLVIERTARAGTFRQNLQEMLARYEAAALEQRPGRKLDGAEVEHNRFRRWSINKALDDMDRGIDVEARVMRARDKFVEAQGPIEARLVADNIMAREEQLRAKSKPEEFTREPGAVARDEDAREAPDFDEADVPFEDVIAHPDAPADGRGLVDEHGNLHTFPDNITHEQYASEHALTPQAKFWMKGARITEIARTTYAELSPDDVAAAFKRTNLDLRPEAVLEGSEDIARALKGKKRDVEAEEAARTEHRRKVDDVLGDAAVFQPPDTLAEAGYLSRLNAAITRLGSLDISLVTVDLSRRLDAFRARVTKHGMTDGTVRAGDRLFEQMGRAAREYQAKVSGKPLVTKDRDVGAPPLLKDEALDPLQDRGAGYISKAPRGTSLTVNRTPMQEPGTGGFPLTGRSVLGGSSPGDMGRLAETLMGRMNLVVAVQDVRAFLKDQSDGHVYATQRHAREALLADPTIELRLGGSVEIVKDNPLDRMRENVEEGHGMSEDQIMAFEGGEGAILKAAMDPDDPLYTGGFRIVSRPALRRFQEHREPHKPKLAARLAGRWKTALLPTSPHWLPGNFIDISLRSTMNGILPPPLTQLGPAYRTGRHVERIQGPGIVAGGLAGAAEGGVRGMLPRRRGRKVVEDLRREAQDATTAWDKFAHAPGIDSLGTWYSHTARAIFSFNHMFIESAPQYARLGRVAKRQFKNVLDRQEKALKTSESAFDDFLRGHQDTPSQLAYAQQIHTIYGNWNVLTPAVRHGLMEYAPFLLWARAALRFVFFTVPSRHPVFTGLAAAAGTMTDQERRQLGLDLFYVNEAKSQGPVPEYLQGALPSGPLKGGPPASADLRSTSSFTSFGVFSGGPLQLMRFLVPLATPGIFAAQGMSWNGSELTNDEGRKLNALQTLIYGSYVTAETFVPFLPVTRRLAVGPILGEKGSKRSLTEAVVPFGKKLGAEKVAGGRYYGNWPIGTKRAPKGPPKKKGKSAGAPAPSWLPKRDTGGSSSAPKPSWAK